jgi:hypothetical protein
VPYQREVGSTTLNRHFLQQMMDPEVWYLTALLPVDVKSTALEHHLAAHDKSTITRDRFKGPAILIADHWFTECT